MPPYISKYLTELLFDSQSDRQILFLLEDIYNFYTKARANLALGVKIYSHQNFITLSKLFVSFSSLQC